MPNWCSTKYVAFTDREDKSELKRLYDNLTAAMQVPSEVDNGFGAGWLGDIAIKHGFNWEDIPCRGTLSYLDEYEAESGFFGFDTETAWGPCEELWEAVIAQYDGVSHVYLSEEPDMLYFVNSDTERRFLTEEFLLEIFSDAPIPDGWYANRPVKPASLEEREYFSGFEGLAEYCADITGREFASLDELRGYFESMFGENAYAIVGIHEFEAA